MRIGVGSYAFRWSIGIRDVQPAQPLSPAGLLEQAAQLGATVVQYADNMPLHLAPTADLDALAERSRMLHVQLEVGTDGASSENLDRYLAIAARLDARVVRLTLDQRDLARPRSELIRHLAQTGAAYQREGAALALENHFRLPSRDLAALVEQVGHPAIGVCLDVANSIANHEWPLETVERLVPYALNLHLKDYRIGIDPYGVGFRIAGAPVGQGELDVGAVLDALKKAGKDVNAIVEHWLPREMAGPDQTIEELEASWTRASLAAVCALV